jgi:hypothetical protein
MNFEIQATPRTPFLMLNTKSYRIVLEGESYPEDTKKFYDEPMSTLHKFLGMDHPENVVSQFKLKYFNSSSAKVLLDLFLVIEEAAVRGNKMTIEWHFTKDDDNMRELGEEFSEELNQAEFKLVSIP